MDNKELPQEIVDEVRHYANMRNTDKQDFGGLLHKICLDDTSKGAQIASEYYEPKLAEKDAKIKEQADQINKLKGLLKGFVEKQPLIVEPGIERLSGKWEYYCKQHGV